VADRGAIAALFAPLVPAGARFAARAIVGPEPPLLPDEHPAAARAVAKRRREVAFGRACAREALGEHVPIPAGPGGVPRWPHGITGSITHTDDHAAALIAERGPITSLGIDLESLAHAARTEDLISTVTTAAERAAFDPSLPLAALVFSAKEAVYKCLYPTAGTFLDFHDVELAIDPAGTFRVLRANGYDPTPLVGRFAFGADHVATVVVAR